jgi:hypothetical protein
MTSSNTRSVVRRDGTVKYVQVEYAPGIWLSESEARFAEWFESAPVSAKITKGGNRSWDYGLKQSGGV